MSTRRWRREKLLLRLRYYCVPLSFPLSFSLSGVPKFFQLRIIIFPGMSRRCFPTPSSRRRLSRENSFRGFLSRTQPRAPLPLIRSQTHRRRRILILLPKNLGWRRALSPFARGSCTSKGRTSAIRSQTSSFGRIRLALLDNYCLAQDYPIREHSLDRFGKKLRDKSIHFI